MKIHPEHSGLIASLLMSKQNRHKLRRSWYVVKDILIIHVISYEIGEYIERRNGTQSGTQPQINQFEVVPTTIVG